MVCLKMPFSSPQFLFGVQEFANPVPGQVKAKHGDYNGNAREGNQPPGISYILSPLGQHQAPVTGRRLGAEAQKAHRRRQNNDPANVDRRQNNNGIEDIGQDVGKHDAQVSAPGHARQADEITLFEAQRLTPHDAGVVGPPHDPEGENDGFGAGTADAGQDEDDDDRGKRNPEVRDTHEEHIRLPADESGNQADHDADGSVESDAAHADKKRYAGSVDKTA